MNVKRWSSEDLVIPYFFDIDQKIHRYTPDVYAEIVNKQGVLKTYLVEIKPKKQLKVPVPPKIKNGKALLRYERARVEYVKNCNKWKTATELCRKKGWEFKVMTEDNLF